MSLKLTKKTLDKCSQNLDSLKKQIQRLFSFADKLQPHITTNYNVLTFLSLFELTICAYDLIEL